MLFRNEKPSLSGFLRRVCQFFYMPHFRTGGFKKKFAYFQIYFFRERCAVNLAQLVRRRACMSGVMNTIVALGNFCLGPFSSCLLPRARVRGWVPFRLIFCCVRACVACVAGSLFVLSFGACVRAFLGFFPLKGRAVFTAAQWC